MPPASIFIVEDELIVSEDIRQILEDQGYTVAGIARSGESVLEVLKDHHPDLVLMDIHLAGAMDGIDTAEQVRTKFHIPVIFLTAHEDESIIARAKVTEPYGYVLKPFNERELHSAIEIGLYKHRMEELAKEKERTIRILAEAIPDPIMLLDHNRQIIALNDAMAQRFGYKYTRVYGDSAIRLDRNSIFNFIESRMNELLNSGHPVHFEKKDGEEWYEISFILIPASEGQHHNFFVQFHDITGRRKFEEQLKKEGITQIEQNMEQFQILNDQIRNPLQAIMGYVSLDCIQYRARIIEQVRVIDSLVNRLDKGWVESEKVRRFLLRHYWDKLDDLSDSKAGSNDGGHS
jgi:two-component system, response regulator PdtaR